MPARTLLILAALACQGPAEDAIVTDASPPEGTSGSGGTGDTGTTEPGALTTVEERLDHLGVTRWDLDSTVLQGTGLRELGGDPLPPGAHPLRHPVAELAANLELYVIGAGQGGGVVVDLDRDGLADAEDHVVARPAGGHEVFAQPVAMALHLDDDGRHELLVVDVRAPSGGGADEVFVQQFEDETEQFAEDSIVGVSVGSWPGATGLVATPRDVDGDGIDEVFLAAVVGPDVALRMYDPATGALSAATLVNQWSNVDPIYAIDVDAGNTDHDASEEVALLINYREWDGVTGSTRVISVDRRDATGADVVGGFDRTVTMLDGRPIVGAGLAWADVDGDYSDELVVGGASTRNESGAYDVRMVIIDGDDGFGVPVYEDQATYTVRDESMVRIRQSQISVARTSVSADTPEIDGEVTPSAALLLDPADDVMINNVLFEFSPTKVGDGNSGTAWPSGTTDGERMAIMARTPRQVLPFGSDSELIIDRDTVQFGLGPVDATGIPHALVLAESAGLFDITAAFGDHTLATTPLLPGGTAHHTQLLSDSLPSMQMVLANVDGDSIVVRYLPGEHRMSYSEPLILAAIAAPPCYEGPEGQYLANCGTIYGNTVTSFESEQGSVGFSVGVMVGYGVEDRTFSQSEAKATVQAKVSAAFATESLQELSFTREHSNGNASDFVLATVLALEQFSYEIVSAPVGPKGEIMAGERLNIYVPRAEAHTTGLIDLDLIRPALRPSQAAAIDSVFVHTPTEPSTYLRRDELADYMAGLGVTGAECNESTTLDFDACGYLTTLTADTVPLASPPVQGTGVQSKSEITYMNTSSSTETWGVESTMNVELSAGGVIFGMELGNQVTSDVTVGHGQAVKYGLAVGGIDPEVYTPYRAAVVGFPYTFACEGDLCQSFEVVTAWVGGDW